MTLTTGKTGSREDRSYCSHTRPPQAVLQAQFQEDVDLMSFLRVYHRLPDRQHLTRHSEQPRMLPVVFVHEARFCKGSVSRLS